MAAANLGLVAKINRAILQKNMRQGQAWCVQFLTTMPARGRHCIAW